MEVIGLLLFTCAVFRATSATALTATVCENSHLGLICGQNSTIDIVSASYGRARDAICPVNPTHVCHAASSERIVRNACQGKRTCRILAANSVFGDPCPGTYKYLNVEYFCKDPPTFAICEFSLHTFSCNEPGKVIDIVRAFYGRTDRVTCPNSEIHTTSCVAATSRAIVEASCNGRSSCTLHASNNVFGDPCRGTFKYLYISYRCIDHPEREISICENRNSVIFCPLGQRIDVYEAYYGRATRRICPYLLAFNFECRSNVIFIVKSICDGRSHCFLTATNSIYGDPCPRRYKYLYVKYRCI